MSIQLAGNYNPFAYSHDTARTCACMALLHPDCFETDKVSCCPECRFFVFDLCFFLPPTFSFFRPNLIFPFGVFRPSGGAFIRNEHASAKIPTKTLLRKAFYLNKLLPLNFAIACAKGESFFNFFFLPSQKKFETALSLK
jgi:hypothetical protein